VLTIGEKIRDDGSRERVTLEMEGGEVCLRVGGAAPARLPEGAIGHVMARYGKPLAEEIALVGPAFEVGDGRLRLLRHRARYDVIARDFLVWEAPGEEPVAELAVAVTAALVHLASAFSGGSGGPP
jgi:hypothetical protein